MKQDFLDDININRSNLSEKISNLSITSMKWRLRLLHEQLKYDELVENHNTLYFNKFVEFHKKISNLTRIESYVKGSKEIIKSTKELEQQEFQVKRVQGFVRVINQLSYTTKRFIEFVRNSEGSF